MNEIAALLRDFGQGASNAAASNVSGPVDLLAWALRKGGVPVPSNPILGSEWMRQKGLLADPRNKIAGLLGEAAGLSAPIAVAAKAPQIARGLLAADDMATAGANRMADHFERTGAAYRYDPKQRGSVGGDYRGLHRAPMKDSGAPLHDLTGGGKVYPDDVYSPMGRQYYGTGDPAIDSEAWNIAMRYKGRPNAPVKMYRAVPHDPTAAEQLAKIEKQKAAYLARRIVPPEWGGSKTSIGDEQGFYDWATKEIERLKAIPPEVRPKLTINNGDWVTTSKAYAKQHGESALGGNFKILSRTVPARKLFTNGDSWAEFGYDASGRITPELLGLIAGGTALGLGGYGLLSQERDGNALVQALKGPR